MPEVGEPDRRQASVVQRLDALGRMRELSVDEQAAVLLHYWADLSVGQVASVLGVPQGTAKIRIYRARSKLGKLICEDG